MKKQVNILGSTWTVETKDRDMDPCLKECDGYCDKTIKSVVAVNKDNDSDLANYDIYQKKCIRHEIVHAFMFESGLAENFEHPNQFGQEETMIDWIAIQGPKIYTAWKEVGAL